MVAGKLLLFGAAAAVFAFAALSGGGAKPAAAAPSPSPGPSPQPQPAPPPPPSPPSTKGKSATDLAQMASDAVAAYGWKSTNGVVAAFQRAWNNAQTAAYNSGSLDGPPAPPLVVDDAWGPLTYTAAVSAGVQNATAAYFQP